jgi:hypothetical protein
MGITTAVSAGELDQRDAIEGQFGGVKLIAYWNAERGACELCESLHGEPEYVWQDEFPDGPDGDEPHPHCRCFLSFEPE